MAMRQTVLLSSGYPTPSVAVDGLTVTPTDSYTKYAMAD